MDDEYKKAIDLAVQQALENNLDGALERAMKQMIKKTARKAWHFLRKCIYAAVLVALWFAANIWFPAGGGGNRLLSVAAAVLFFCLLAASEAIPRRVRNAAGTGGIRLKPLSLSWLWPYLLSLALFAAALLLAYAEKLGSTATVLANLALALPGLLPFIRGVWHTDGLVKQIQDAFAAQFTQREGTAPPPRPDTTAEEAPGAAPDAGAAPGVAQPAPEQP